MRGLSQAQAACAVTLQRKAIHARASCCEFPEASHQNDADNRRGGQSLARLTSHVRSPTAVPSFSALIYGTCPERPSRLTTGTHSRGDDRAAQP